MCLFVPSEHLFIRRLITTIYKGPMTKQNYKKIPCITVMKGNWFQNLQFFRRNSLKLPSRNKFIFGSLGTILLCIVGELAGAVDVAVGVSDM